MTRKRDDAAQKARKKARRAREVEVAKAKRLELAVAELKRVKLLFSPDSERCYTCIDVEAWERDSKRVTEVGVACLNTSATADAAWEFRHFVIKENVGCRNGTFVSDNREYFLFGNTETVKQKVACSELARILARTTYLVGHDLRGDVEWLRAMGISFDGGLARPSAQIDTQQLAHATRPEKHFQIALKTLLLDHFAPIAPIGMELRDLRLHNGGNDAAWTMAVLLALVDCADVAPPRPVTTSAALAAAAPPAPKQRKGRRANRRRHRESGSAGRGGGEGRRGGRGRARGRGGGRWGGRGRGRGRGGGRGQAARG